MLNLGNFHSDFLEKLSAHLLSPGEVPVSQRVIFVIVPLDPGAWFICFSDPFSHCGGRVIRPSAFNLFPPSSPVHAPHIHPLSSSFVCFMSKHCPSFFFTSSLSLLRLSMFSFVTSVFIYAHWSISAMAPLKSFPDNSNVCVLSLLASLHCLFSMTLRAAWILVELVLFYYTLDTSRYHETLVLL